MARAMRGKRLDDELVVHTPDGKREYFIVAIRYEG